MSFVFRDRKIKMSRCTSCDADLLVHPDGTVVCSNGRCRFREGHPKRPYPTYKGAAPKAVS
jgi:hypothetical protein